MAEYDASSNGRFALFREAGDGKYASYEKNYLADVELLKEEVKQHLPSKQNEALKNIESFVRHIKDTSLDEDAFVAQEGPKLLRVILLALRDNSVPDDLKKIALDELVHGIQHCAGGVGTRMQTACLILQSKNTDMPSQIQNERRVIADAIVRHTLSQIKFSRGNEIHCYNKVYNEIADILNLKKFDDMFENAGHIEEQLLTNAKITAHDAFTPAALVDRLAQSKFERLIEIFNKPGVEPKFLAELTFSDATPKLETDWINLENIDEKLLKEVNEFFNTELRPLVRDGKLDLFYMTEQDEDCANISLRPVKEHLRELIIQGFLSASRDKIISASSPEQGPNGSFEAVVFRNQVETARENGKVLLAVDGNIALQASAPIPDKASASFEGFRLFERLAGEDNRAIVTIQNMSFKTARIDPSGGVEDLQPVTLGDLRPYTTKVPSGTSFRSKVIESVLPDLSQWPRQVTHPLIMQAIENTRSADDLLHFYQTDLHGAEAQDFFAKQETEAVLTAIQRSPDLQAQLLEKIAEPVNHKNAQARETRTQLNHLIDTLKIPRLTAKVIETGHQVSFDQVNNVEAIAYLPKETIVELSDADRQQIAKTAVARGLSQVAVSVLAAGQLMIKDEPFHPQTIFAYAVQQNRPATLEALIDFMVQQKPTMQAQILGGTTLERTLEQGSHIIDKLIFDAAQKQNPENYLRPLIKGGADLSITGSRWRTLLHHNCIRDPEIFNAVLDSFKKRGISNDKAIHQVDLEDWSPLIFHVTNPFKATAETQHSSVANLLRAGADPLFTGKETKVSMLQQAAKNAKVETLRLLVDACREKGDHFDVLKEINSYTKERNGDTVLTLAVLSPIHSKEENAEKVRYLIEQGADVTLRRKSNNVPPLYMSIEVGNVEATKLILSELHRRGEDLNAHMNEEILHGQSSSDRCLSRLTDPQKQEIFTHLEFLLDPEATAERLSEPITQRDLIADEPMRA
ncbi:hypothetical protein [Pseudovibrio sp. POLY-S9]|uniref:hypothetical protein n=1 Tax=Pseudovibrio sp. POLY-S9 TaxID=1576596 RepID=UPI00128F2711|nr:hypothetical protein [Pseudovibrio sp. POLY-S9]